MVAKHQFLRVRLQVNLALQVGDSKFADVVSKHGNRHDQRHQTMPVVIDQGDHFAARGRVEMLAEVAEHVLQDIGVTCGRRELFSVRA